LSARYLTIPKFAELSGYSTKAIEVKIARGVWLENRQYRRAPDGRVLVDTIGYEKWVEGQLEPSSRARAASA
jgi:hypothetical protein